MKIIIFSCLIICCLSIFKENLFLKENIFVQTRKNDDIINFQIKTRSRYGFVNFTMTNNSSLLHISCSNIKNTNPYECIQEISVPLKIHFQDDNYYPIGYSLNDLNIKFNISKNEFLKYFNNSIYIEVLYSINYKFISQFEKIENFVISMNRSTIGFSTYLRYESVNLSIFIISLISYLFIFCLLFLLRNYQPLKSRGIVPFISLFINLIFIALSGIEMLFLSFESNTKYFIYMEFISMSLQLSIGFITIIQLFRYSSILYLKRKKMDIYKKNDHLNFNLKCLNFIGFSLIQFIIFFIIFIFLLILLLSVYLLFNQNVSFIDGLFYIFILLFFPLIFINLLIEIILHWKYIKKIQIWKIWKSDIHFKRIEGYILGIFVLIYFIFNLIYLFLTNNLILKVSNLFITMFVNSFTWNFIFFYQTVFVLLITIVNIFKRYFIKKNEDQTIPDKSSYLYKEFKRYIKLDIDYFSLYTCYLEIQDYKIKSQKNLENSQILGIGNRIYDLFFSKDAEFLIHVPKEISNNIKRKLETNIVVKNLFDEVEFWVCKDLEVIFNNFKLTNEYKLAYLNENLLENNKIY